MGATAPPPPSTSTASTSVPAHRASPQQLLAWNRGLLGRRSQPSHPRYHLRRRRLPRPNADSRPCNNATCTNIALARSSCTAPASTASPHATRHFAASSIKRPSTPSCNPESAPTRPSCPRQARPVHPPRRPLRSFQTTEPQLRTRPGRSATRLDHRNARSPPPRRVDRPPLAPERGIVLPRSESNRGRSGADAVEDVVAETRSTDSTPDAGRARSRLATSFAETVLGC